MTVTAVRPRHPALTLPFARHLAGMFAAMLVGMLVLDPFWRLPGALTERADVAAFVMATDMSAGMAVWMWHRGHGAAAIGEMTAAMYAPFAVLLIPWWTGLVPGDVALLGGHLLMLPAMVAVLLHRIDDPVAGPRTGVLSHWPGLLGLLCAADILVNRRPLAAWTVLVLPAGYLLIGAARRALRPRRVLLVQLTALIAYAVLAVTAASVTPRLGLLLIGLGWLVHAGWDVWHHRRDAVVPRAYAEWCTGLDVAVGLSLIGLAVAG